ncbi:PRC-barrel domain-containing protein [Patescibacteria group bacterium]|nr:PRC-barrel domain-containing protein [Patescibacteria group bacterium]
MLINFENLKDLPVETQSGQQIGRLESIIIDIDSQSIYQYVVKPSGIKNIFEKELLISREQIISINKDKIIVDDSTYASTAGAKKETKKARPQLQPEPITRE